MDDSPLNATLRKFEAVEANLCKAERLHDVMEAALPQGIAFVIDHDFDQNTRDFSELVETLPKIDGWKPSFSVMGLNEIAQARLDAQEIDEVECRVSVEESIQAPARALREYRHRFNRKRRELIRDSLIEQIDEVDALLRTLSDGLVAESGHNLQVVSEGVGQVKSAMAKVAMLIGNSIPKPSRWSDLQRHLSFGQYGDLHDIIEHDWPAVRKGLLKSMYGENEAVPVDVDDLGDLVSARPKGQVANGLKWSALTEEAFERLMFNLISTADGYENPQWLTKTNAPDRGRDLSVDRIHEDQLAGTTRLRVIIQCKHWLTKSVGVSEIATLKEQMRLWNPPRVDICVVATSGRFSSDAVSAVEHTNASDTGLRIEMWPESHLERLLAARPGLIAEFHLR